MRRARNAAGSMPTRNASHLILNQCALVFPPGANQKKGPFRGRVPSNGKGSAVDLIEIAEAGISPFFMGRWFVRRNCFISSSSRRVSDWSA